MEKQSQPPRRPKRNSECCGDLHGIVAGKVGCDDDSLVWGGTIEEGVAAWVEGESALFTEHRGDLIAWAGGEPAALLADNDRGDGHDDTDRNDGGELVMCQRSVHVSRLLEPRIVIILTQPQVLIIHALC